MTAWSASSSSCAGEAQLRQRRSHRLAASAQLGDRDLGLRRRGPPRRPEPVDERSLVDPEHLLQRAHGVDRRPALRLAASGSPVAQRGEADGRREVRQPTVQMRQRHPAGPRSPRPTASANDASCWFTSGFSLMW